MKLGVVFPGQGSQSVGMLRDIANEFPEIQAAFNEASDKLGYDLWELVSSGPAEELDKTVHTQPAILTASYAMWRLLNRKKKFIPAFLAGHSLGEYTALVCAEAMAFGDAVMLVKARGQYMQEAVPSGKGGLAAIVGLDNDIVEDICKKSALENEVLSPVNFNSPGQVVIGGHIQAVERAIVLSKEAGARLAKLLPVSVPSHCVLMKPAAEKLSALLQQVVINPPVFSVLSNVDVQVYESADMIRDGLTRQLFMPVRWVETIQAFSQKGISHLIECGPGKVLSGLNKRIVSDLRLSSTADLPSLQDVFEETFQN